MSNHDASIAAVSANIARAHEAIRQAQNDAGRVGAVALVAVSKQQPEARLRAALDAGHRVFGENRVQEAASKWPALREVYEGVELHLVGPLQSNKAADAVALFDVIETVDREKIAAALAAECARQAKRPRLFVQVNTGEEPQKAGVAPGEVEAFVDRCRNAHGLDIEGLMCIPPADEPPAPHFALLAKLAQRCGVRALSMGMSGDYPIAVQLGATHVRIGEGVFGARNMHGAPPEEVR
jgi:hypothetical protein